MPNQFYNHLNKFTEISEVEFAEVLSYFEMQKFGKKEILMQAGSICNKHFFVLSGCLQMFYTNEK